MRKIFVLLFCIASIHCLFAQQNRQVNREQLESFKKSTTYVVMDDNPMLGYNITIKAAVGKFWKITPFKFISISEFEAMRMDCKKSFIMLTKVNLTKETTGAEYLYLNFLMGDSVKDMNQMPEILVLPLAYNGVDENSYVYKMGVIVRFAQEHVKTLMASKILFPYKNLTYYNMSVRDIKKKTLLVETTDLSDEVNTIEKIKTVYPYEIRLVSSDEIEKAVNAQTPNTLILHVISPSKDEASGRSYKIIYGVDDSKIYYYNYEKISQTRPAGFLLKDFKRIATE